MERDIIIFIIILLIFIITIYLLAPYINLNREAFATGKILKDIYFDKNKRNNMTPADFYKEYDNMILTNNGIDDYEYNYKLIFKRCYNFPKNFAEKLLLTTDTNSNLITSVPYANIFRDIIDTSINISNLCIHKYVKYTDTINDILNSIDADIEDFYSKKLLLIPDNEKSIVGNVYLLMSQIPYMVDQKHNMISVKYDSDSLGYTSYYKKDKKTDNAILSGKKVYIYYIIYDSYTSDYTQIPINTSGKFEKKLLPLLQKYASSDESCLTTCDINDKNKNGYMCGCISTIPYKKNKNIYDQNNPSDDLDYSINAIGSDFRSLLSMNSSENFDATSIKRNLSPTDITDLNGGYAGRCLNNETGDGTGNDKKAPQITNYMTLYMINQITYKKNNDNNQIFYSQKNNN
jgi:hypothetical protein